ncbi:MAG: peptidylprolyl isomerase [Hyphomicrobium sp.]|uniref:peptidylprolyl isomerase n=1 Tax=Hyphomicrobium sp. TaxID=82 RepID=UPI0025C09FE1|nr:peptidylprolyl isomerase [Hyphomicrobium sp.]MBZ0208855.1 peptidylprolyl isomerase [Hyphomicrobium sp.]
MRALAGFALLAAIAFAVDGTFAVAQDAAGDKVVATVDGKAITEGDMKLAEGEIGSELGQLPADVRRRALAEYLIDNQLFANAAEAAKLGDTPEFQKYMAYLRQRALREQFFEKTLKGSVSEDEAKKIYNERVAQMKPETEFAARHILVADEAKAKELRAKIAAGEDFAKLAGENSTDPVSKKDGGFLGYFGMGQMVPEFEAQVAKMQKGELSEPVKTAYGWHIIKLEDRRQKQPPTFEQVKDTIMNSLAVRKAQEKSAELRGKAKVDYVDADIKKMVEEQQKKQAEAMEAAKKAAEQGAQPAPGAAAPATPPAAKP